MKKFILPIVLVVAVLSSCKTEQTKDVETSRQLLLTPDTTNLRASGINTDVAKGEEVNYEVPKRRVAVAPRRRSEPRYNAPVAQPSPVVTAAPPVVTTPVVTATPEVTTTATSTGTSTETTSVPVVKEETQKKGISDAAKGAAIGGVGGAIAGAVIGKNGKGAVIGGVIGAAGGYILGRQKDKKSGRVEYSLNK